jgi:hypothetical protein
MIALSAGLYWSMRRNVLSMSSVADTLFACTASAIDEAVADSAENGGGGFFNVDCMSLLPVLQGSTLPPGEGKTTALQSLPLSIHPRQ